MSLFDRHIIVDWSGGNDRGAKPTKDAIWAGVSDAGVVGEPLYFRTRAMVEAWLVDQIEQALLNNKRLCIGFDFPFAYPAGFARAVCGRDDPLGLWDWLAERVEDAPKSNNRFDIAAKINAMFDHDGPFWGNGLDRDIAHLPRKKPVHNGFSFAERREVEQRAPGSFTCFQMSGAGAVGGQVIMGLPALARLRQRFAGKVSVWPFEPLVTQIALVEVWPSLLRDQVNAAVAGGGIKDAHQVRLLAKVIGQLDSDGDLAEMLAKSDVTKVEGWILGVGSEDRLSAASQTPARLPDDCFALPPGVAWTPLHDALGRLDAALGTVAGLEVCAVDDALDRVLAQDVVAARSNPPQANAAVDGFGYRAEHVSAGVIPLCQGRAAAGAPFETRVPEGFALRILTGAAIPKGVDTVILEEDCQIDADAITALHLPKPGANTRAAGEDMEAGDIALQAGTILRPPDLALAAALGLHDLPVYARLRVGVLSTGDELVPAGKQAKAHQIFDANRPMLLGLLQKWGYAPIDLGHVKDDRDALRTRLNEAHSKCDAVLSTGGASAGDEDHVSALLRSEGRLSSWRIAIKPGRPLVLAQWQGMPVFGLPGNPVAALVCSLIVARPALSHLAGAAFTHPRGFDVPAAFDKDKKPGRREYLRARLNDAGHAEVFASEGSGRISGLSWADGLVELADGARLICPGDLVRYIPYSSFGL